MPYPDKYTANRLGLRATRNTAALPQTAQAAIFTITGGRVIITALVGEVTTAMDATATNLKVTANPTVGADVDIAANVAVASDPAGTLYTLPSAFATALAKGQAVPLAANGEGVVASPGTIDLVTSASNAAGRVKWTMYWLPLDSGARVVAA